MGFLDELKGAINEAADTITKVVDKVEKPLTDKATNIAKSASGYTNEAVDFINKTVDKVEKPLTDKATEIANDVTKEVKNQVDSIQAKPQAEKTEE